VRKKTPNGGGLEERLLVGRQGKRKKKKKKKRETDKRSRALNKLDTRRGIDGIQCALVVWLRGINRPPGHIPQSTAQQKRRGGGVNINTLSNRKQKLREETPLSQGFVIWRAITP